MPRSRALLAYGLLAGAAVVAYVAYRDEAGWSGPLRGLRTSAGPGSKAQTLADLRAREAELAAELEAVEADVSSEFQRRMSRANYDALADEIERECSGVGGFLGLACPFDPYCGCDDQVVARHKAEARSWRDRVEARRVAPIRAELDTVRAELDALHLAA